MAKANSGGAAPAQLIAETDRRLLDGGFDLAIIEEISKQYPDSGYVKGLRLIAAASEGDDETAKSIADALRPAGDAEDAHRSAALAYYYWQAGAPEEAKTHAEQSRAADPEDQHVWRLLAESYLTSDDGDFAAAVKTLRKALALYPGAALVEAELALALLGSGDEAAFGEAAQIADKMDGEALSGYGYHLKARVAALQEQYDEAVRCFNGALKLNPDDFDSRLLLVDLLDSLEAFDQTGPHIETLMEQAPESDEVWFYRSRFLRNEGAYIEAAQAIDRALGFLEKLGLEEPDDEAYLQYALHKAYLLADLNMPDASLELVEELREKFGPDMYADAWRVTLFAMMDREEDFDLAAAQYMSQFGNDPEAEACLLDSLEEIGVEFSPDAD